MNNKINIEFILNKKKISKAIKPSLLLIDLIRDELLLKGTKPGCLEGECGACAVLINDVAVNSCLYLALNIDGKEVITIEGFAEEDGTLDAVQKALVNKGGVQCGFCTPGMAASIKSFSNKCKKEGKNPDRDDIKKSLEGNLCRCTGYVKIIEAAEEVCKTK